MTMSHSAPRPRRSLARLALPILASGVVVACLAVLLSSGGPTGVTESQVHREIREIALRKNGVDDGGSVGPWWISARAVDPVTGEFHDFKLESGALHLAAKSAELRVDADTDTLRFHLRDVVLTRVTDAKPGDPEPRLHRMETYDLGPVAWRTDIVPDGADGAVQPLAATGAEQP